ncbi:MAG: hypothetical protein NC340_09695 [Ruminococcus flavefaciens]|nr:hypothetical protein [Ruminococcus flavefaciens]MCM1230586.1 hypothetical protein [Ruminococcus flavefaciens]
MDNPEFDKFEIKKKEETVAKTIRITTEMEEKLEKLASENNISFNALVVQCIEYSMAHLDK